MTEKLVKRFIAGAVCPKCKAVDRVVVYHHNAQDFAECVECGFQYDAANPHPPKDKERPSPKTEKIIFLKKRKDA